MLSTFFTSDPMYSLAPSSKYPVERRTLNHRIPYYVKENFGNEYQGSLGRLENAVEEEYILNMKRACFNEKNYREYFTIMELWGRPQTIYAILYVFPSNFIFVTATFLFL